MFKKRLLPLLFNLVFISGCTPLLNPDIASQSMPQEQVKEDIDKVLADEEPITEASTEATTEEAAGDASAAISASTSETQDAAATAASSASSANAVPHFVQAQNAASEKTAQNNAASTPASTQNTQDTPAQTTSAESAQPAPVQRNLGAVGKAYEKAAKDFNANYNNYKYDLIYSDDDNTPELVIDTGKKVTIYTITNNKARLIVRNQNTAKWKYGTSSFCYVPKKALFFDNNNNCFGCICEDGHVGDGSMLVSYTINNMNIYPKVSEVTPSAGADYPDSSQPASYRNQKDNSVSAEQAQNEILAIFNYDWQKIQGTMDFNALLAKLEEMGV
ncbi:hypothetical protein SAMN02910451_02773 [Butyrivibrio hungatei]|uniref:Uncharacterized protein n=1 Tax=Butyrivibrio hungatei TaxID=185008 RepID=A0A1G5G982_9FIRM|nr:hypothetical protein [Butyrivibrio hungatei]SCY48063.1 hypothetical protein SAMN02910451_02773 [Butyrivibrio hungatei]